MTYGFTLHKEIALEAHSIGNLMRFANHGSSPFTNCNSKQLICSRDDTHFMFLQSICDIEKGEELIFDYGLP